MLITNRITLYAWLTVEIFESQKIEFNIHM